jgi:hypothetical protein
VLAKVPDVRTFASGIEDQELLKAKWKFEAGRWKGHYSDSGAIQSEIYW